VDIVSAVEFNETGEYIATGDRGGRVVIFERCQVIKQAPHLPPYFSVFVSFTTRIYIHLFDRIRMHQNLKRRR
jgi:hypothetical protein